MPASDSSIDASVDGMDRPDWTWYDVVINLLRFKGPSLDGEDFDEIDVQQREVRTAARVFLKRSSPSAGEEFEEASEAALLARRLIAIRAIIGGCRPIKLGEWYILADLAVLEIGAYAKEAIAHSLRGIRMDSDAADARESAFNASRAALELSRDARRAALEYIIEIRSRRRFARLFRRLRKVIEGSPSPGIGDLELRLMSANRIVHAAAKLASTFTSAALQTMVEVQKGRSALVIGADIARKTISSSSVEATADVDLISLLIQIQAEAWELARSGANSKVSGWQAHLFAVEGWLSYCFARQLERQGKIDEAKTWISAATSALNAAREAEMMRLKLKMYFFLRSCLPANGRGDINWGDAPTQSECLALQNELARRLIHFERRNRRNPS